MPKLFYDVPAEGYSELYGKEQVAKYKLVFDKLKLEFFSILDIGCGVGLLTEYLGNISFRGMYIGVDVSCERIKYAKKNLNVNEYIVDYVVADAHHLPFRDKCFQLSASFTVFHLLNTSKAVKEALRVSKKIMVITLLKKRMDLKKSLTEEIKRIVEVVELESQESEDYIFISHVG